MNSQFLIEKLEFSDEYKKFIGENPTAYLCSGFFDIGTEKNSENKYHFDFYVPETKKTFSFQLEDGKLVELERNYEEKILDKVLLNRDFDFDKIKERIMIEMELQEIKNKIQKMIFSLQNIDGKDLLFGTIFLSGLGLLKVNIDIYDNKIIDFEKKSLLDMIKVVKKNDKP
ncbi:MAG: hypothetical protein PHQ66_01850 [Candidatus Nanoarchaeia archaeon]|nr:hypothetical protein [Candidatus Nanoarchaeia archaeon]MDD5357882.1 hypothetical protein [Candidatus Nanoarchaeia archaeon]MDD5588801.1 hypothetical protein [Candidatus Nanoarchaeia archaeon]